MRLRIASSGSLPDAAPMFSRTCATLLVAGMAHVTAGCATMNLRRNCAQFAQSISRALAERAVDDHGDPALLRQRQDALLDLAVEDVVRHLHEVERVRSHDLLDLAVAASFRRRDAVVADPLLGLHREQHRQLLLPGE